MWLHDVNLPNGLVPLLKKLGIESDTTVARGWRDLGNGALASEASKAGFRVILTKDKLFGETAAKALKNFPSLCIVILRLPQSRQSAYLKSFETEWNRKPIQPEPGKIIEWP